MRLWLAIALLIASTAATAGGPALRGPAFQAGLRSPVGTNLEMLAYWSPQVPFVDVMKSSSEWLSGNAKDWGGGPPLDLDANGWVRSLRPGQVARKLMLREFGDRYPGGRYLVRYKGEGKLNFGFAAKIVSQRRGEMVIEVTPNDGGVYAVDRRDQPGELSARDRDPHARRASAKATRSRTSRRHGTAAAGGICLFPDNRRYSVLPGVRRPAARLLGAALHGLDAHQQQPGGDLGAAHAAGLQHLGHGARRAGRSDDRARQPGGRAPVVHAAAPERRGLRTQPCADGQGKARPGARRIRGALERSVELASSRSTATFRSRRRRCA